MTVEAWRVVAHATCHHRDYNLTCEDYETLLTRSNGCCEMCGKPAADNHRGKLGIDHEHRIGWHAVRGLLCQKCNAHMHHVDVGRRPIDERTARYLALSGHVLPQPPPLPHPRAGYRLPRVKLPPARIMREFAAWYHRQPGAKLPQRPPPANTTN